MMKRAIWTVSVSLANPDAVVVTQALMGTPKGERSALLLKWAAAYLQGRALETPAIIDGLGMTDEELDGFLDDF